jgi:hypothetical protein
MRTKYERASPVSQLQIDVMLKLEAESKLVPVFSHL